MRFEARADATPSRSAVEGARDVFREVRAIARQGALILRAAERTRRAPAPGSFGADRYVLFVHGFMARGPVWDPMRHEVAQVAHVETDEVTYGSFETFDAVCERVRDLIAKRAQARPVTLVGHSLGGLIARAIVQDDLDRSLGVDTLITLATPHGGTRLARIAAGPLVRAIQPGSSVLRELDSTAHRLETVRCLALVAARDRLVTPPASAAALPGATVTWLDVGHNEILFSPEATAIVASEVRRSPPCGR